MKLVVTLEAKTIEAIRHGLRYCLREVETELALDGEDDGGMCGHEVTPNGDVVKFDIGMEAGQL